jgi:hypothetical protein
VSKEKKHQRKRKKKKRAMKRSKSWCAVLRIEKITAHIEVDKNKSKLMKMQTETRRCHCYAAGTHPVPDLLVSPGIDQQPHTLRVTIRSGPNQRRISVL